MRELFTLDAKNYDKNSEVFNRPSVRGIIIKNGKIAMVHSLKYDYYKFPGGGIDGNETHMETLKREVLEEAGLEVIESTVKEFGKAKRIEKGKENNIFNQENFYYLCDVKNTIKAQNLDDYEAEEKFTLVYITPEIAIKANSRDYYGPKSIIMIKREAKVLEMLISEGYFG